MNARRLVKRVKAMDARELRTRSSSLLRQTASRVAFSVRRPIWQRSSFAGALVARDSDLESGLAAARRDDWRGAHLSVSRSAERGWRFVLDPRRRAEIAATIQATFPTAPSGAVERAERVLDGRFDLLGYSGLSFGGAGGAIDWHYDPVHGRRPPRVFWDRVRYLSPECGDHKIIWELNRHQHWLTLGRAYWLTGDRRFRDHFVAQLYGWLDANPPLEGINWASMLELGLRALSWIWALHFFADEAAAERNAHEPPWTIDLLVGLDRQLALVEQNLSRYFSPNTHLIGEALALYVSGSTLPLARAPRWASLGRSVLVEEIERQINRDGGHVELSTHYHRYTLDFYLLALGVALATNDPVAPVLSEAVNRLATFARAIADDRGRLPALGDDDGGSLLPFCGRAPSDAADSLQIAARFLSRPDLHAGAPAEEVIWMTGQLPSNSPPAHRWPSAALRDSGYHVSRSGDGDLLTIDAGPHGFLNGGHAHADGLSVTLTVGLRPLLVDPGTGCYTIDPEVRDRFRSTALHNTLTLDGRSQSIPDGPFHWQSAANASALEWESGPGFDYFAGEHDGYLPAVHRRSVLSRPGCWTIVDRVAGDGAHRADVHWHVDPVWRVEAVNQHSAKLIHPDGTIAWILAAGGGVSLDVLRGARDSSGLGWCSPVYGSIVPTSTVRISTRGSPPGSPIAVACVIVLAEVAPEVEIVPVEGRGGAFGLRLRSADWTDTMVFAETTAGRPPSIWNAESLESDATLVWWRDDVRQGGKAIACVGGMVREAVGLAGSAR